MASASVFTRRSQFWPSNFLRKGVMLFDFAKTSKVLHPEVRTIIRKLRSSQNSAFSLLKIGAFILPKGRCALSPLAFLPVGVEPTCRAKEDRNFLIKRPKTWRRY